MYFIVILSEFLHKEDIEKKMKEIYCRFQLESKHYMLKNKRLLLNWNVKMQKTEIPQAGELQSEG